VTDFGELIDEQTLENATIRRFEDLGYETAFGPVATNCACDLINFIFAIKKN